MSGIKNKCFSIFMKNRKEKYMFFKEFELPKGPSFPNRDVNIREYGAVEGELSTKAINDAIASVSEMGGGTVIVPAGKWLTGAIKLQSNVNLHFSAGAEVQFSHNPEDYLPVVLTMYEGIRCMNYSPLIYGCDLENVAITGKGVLDGAGLEW